MQKNKNYKERDSEQTFGKKAYQERLLEEKQAEKEIEEFDIDDEDNERGWFDHP
jgi:hypothetical protein